MKPLVLITQGDYNGIGPEITLKAVSSPEVQQRCIPVLVGSIDVFAYYAKTLRLRQARSSRMTILLKEIQELNEARNTVAPGTIPVIHHGGYERFAVTPGKLSADAGRLAGSIVTLCVTLCLQKRAHAVVTAPVSKEALGLGGYRYSGQTELLAKLCKSRQYAMMLVADNFRIGLATIHLPLKTVYRSIQERQILEKIKIIYHSITQDFATAHPKIAVLGLNPHAGENGLLGREEKEEILPALRKARRLSIHTEGPLPADGFFGTHAYKSYDAVLAMYHDQGLIPLKMVGFERGVNFTAGLPIVRTSPDHGTAFDIAGKGIANPSSMIEAIKLAVVIVKNRMKG
jgi:4-hydroxythreonine-4-phosphate dehydrogenase